jgi:hypothetical protein
MALSPIEQEARDRYFEKLLAVAFSLQQGPDREVDLEALIEASQMLTERLQQELTALRQEQAE